ncbi:MULTISPECIES: hypothetical protein [Paraburkholderia]|uniref:Uncharacterized protein n=1 Tax=Paraburkholderia fynbosensis TaxID=1200993 RepID=A0A6J5GIS5_9BURK|nr:MULTISPECIES: hypothetical protein [Paraburkholderia]RKT21416.1 hypothetical protein B0G69_4805 [Paraburkholderia sp. RAU2J]CAB3798867.1 hypothetical protein LMG27177_04503 [Paraburkholderia fynbosensis]
MKVLKIVLIACSLSAAVAHAQTAPAAAAAPEQQVAQADAPRTSNVVAPKRSTAPKARLEECVGPVSFCSIYFGS